MWIHCVLTVPFCLGKDLVNKRHLVLEKVDGFLCFFFLVLRMDKCQSFVLLRLDSRQGLYH